MNLLAYTKKLSEKISYYDKLTKNRYMNISITNPFAKPVNLTIVWVENCENEKDE